MQLLDYMKQQNITDEDLAAKIGGCSAFAVRKWKYRERQPSADVIYKIGQITSGSVSLSDWLSAKSINHTNQQITASIYSPSE